MITSLNLLPISCVYTTYSSHRPANLRRHNLSVVSLSINTPSFSSSPTTFTSSVGSPPRNPTQPHLNFIASVAAISATLLFCSAIPMLLAFKRAAESLENLLDVIREEIPDTMAAVRLSGMEISDLTMELSDLGQEITQGVKSSAHVVRVAEERLRQLTNMNPSAGGGPSKTRTRRTSGS